MMEEERRLCERRSLGKKREGFVKEDLLGRRGGKLKKTKWVCFTMQNRNWA
jgi:hypothetical protein